MAAHLRPRRRAEGKPEALFEGDPSFARGFGETNRARRGLRVGGVRKGRNPDASLETSVLLLPMFHVEQFARRGFSPSGPRGGRRADGAPAGGPEAAPPGPAARRSHPSRT